MADTLCVRCLRQGVLGMTHEVANNCKTRVNGLRAHHLHCTILTTALPLPWTTHGIQDMVAFECSMAVATTECRRTTLF